ncbi:hypothetical protein BTJ68_00761 [Hortaea werneckii EXF-2000]|nr:hypothetical protein BTJ68_00761 [Hortaea werneckii EXF-2000]
MRTKQTTDKKKAANGLSTPSATPDMVRSPTAPQELTEADRARLRAFLNKSDKPFSIETIPATRKRKRGSADPHTEPNLDDERLTVQYEVKPASNWESLRKYKKFTVGDESIGAGEHVLVKHDDTDDGKVDYAAQWKAKVLEVRALDSEHVYVRVAWLNRPEDLDTGRKSYHGKNELIPTNQLDIIDAMTVNGKLDVYKWEEENDDSTMPDPEE